MLTHKNAKATAVLAIMFDMADFDENKWYYEGYVNGREQGYSVFSWTHRVAFSENRNSDSIVVYVGSSIEFSMQGNTPSDKIYKGSKHFSCNQYREAAEYAVKYLKNNK